MERSRGGLTTKIHALVDANSNAIALKLTEGQAHDGRSAGDMLGDISTGQTLIVHMLATLKSRLEVTFTFKIDVGLDPIASEWVATARLLYQFSPPSLCNQETRAAAFMQYSWATDGRDFLAHNNEHGAVRPIAAP